MEKVNNNWNWRKKDKTIHYSNLDLISEFKEIKLNDFDFELKAHPAHNLNDLENINVLNDLIGHIGRLANRCNYHPSPKH